MAGNFRIVVNKSNMYFARINIDMQLGGDLASVEAALQFDNGSGQTVTANQVLYTEGTLGNQDFFEIKSKYNTVLNGDNFIQVIVSAQFTIPIGNYVEVNPVILGTPPFSFRVYSI